MEHIKLYEDFDYNLSGLDHLSPDDKRKLVDVLASYAPGYDVYKSNFAAWYSASEEYTYNRYQNECIKNNRPEIDVRKYLRLCDELRYYEDIASENLVAFIRNVKNGMKYDKYIGYAYLKNHSAADLAGKFNVSMEAGRLIKFIIGGKESKNDPRWERIS